MQTTIKPLFIRASNRKDYEAVGVLLMQLMPVNLGGFKDISEFSSYWKSHPYVNIDCEQLNGSSSPDVGVPTFDYPKQITDIILYITETKSYKVENLTRDYDAEVLDGKISVGCQTVSFEKFDELAKIVAEYRKDKN